MNATDINIAHKNCSNKIICNMGDMISKENMNKSKYMKIPDNHMNALHTDNTGRNQGKPITEKIKLAIDSFDAGGSNRDAKTGNTEKNTERVYKTEMSEDRNNQCVNKCCTNSEMVDFEQYKMLQGFMTELQSIIRGLYEAKFNHLNVLLCTCCNNSAFSSFEKPDDLYLDDAIESDNDSDECSNCDACEATTLKESNSRSQCGCVDPSGFPHHVSRKLRNPRCIDTRVIYLVERLYEEDPHKLFQQLETQVHNIITNLHNHLETFMKNHNNDTKHSKLFIVLILECYQILCSAAKRVTPMLMQLQRGHLSRFSLTWDLLNRSIYLECIHVKMQPYVLEFISQCRKLQTDVKLHRDDLFERYIKLDGEMTLISAMWYDVNGMIEDYNNDRMVSQDKQKKLDNHYQALLDLEAKHKRIKNHKMKRSYSEPLDEQLQQNISIISKINSARNKGSNIISGLPTKSYTYHENYQCFAPELCISEEVIRVLNKETDGAVDSTNIKASSTPRGDIVCLPGDHKRMLARQNMEGKSLLSKDASKVLSSLTLDNSGNLQTTDQRGQLIMLSEDFPESCKGDILDCKHHNSKPSQKIPIHSPTCKSGLNSIANGENSVSTLTTNVKCEQTNSCPKHGKRKLHNPDWESKYSRITVGDSKPEASNGNKPHSHGHNCKKSCGGGGDGHVHWTPNTHNKGCACCYCSVYDGTPPNTCSPVSRKYNETRERLRGKLNKTKAMNKASKVHVNEIMATDSNDPSRDSSCRTSTETRDVNKLLEWIEGASNKQQRDPIKKAEKKARQKLKKLADKEKDDEVMVPVPSPELKQMYMVPEPSRTNTSNCGDGMVNIRLLTSDVPRVAVTAVGSSPDKNKLLYTLINGQKIIPELEISKKKKKTKQVASVSVINIENTVVEETKSKIKQKKNEKNRQIFMENIINNKTCDKLVKGNIKQPNISSLEKVINNKEIRKDNNKVKNSNYNQKILNVDFKKTPKCQDKFCQTDDKLSYADEIIINPIKLKNNDKMYNKKEKHKQKEKQVDKLLDILDQNKQDVISSDKKNYKSKFKNKGAINTKSAKSKSNDNIVKNLNKTDSDLNSSQEWIEINSKSSLNSNSKKTNKSKKNESELDQNLIMNKTLTKALENLNISKDTTIEITKENDIKSNAGLAKKKLTSGKPLNGTSPSESNKKVKAGKCNEYSIMDQLNQGVGVERLKLPPGITLTKVDAATAYANQNRKTQQITNKIVTSNIPKIQEYAMIIANPVQNEADCTKPEDSTTFGKSTKARRKKRRKNKNCSANSNNTTIITENKQTKMITLRNPLFQTSMLKLNSNAVEEYNLGQTELAYNPIPMPKQASITQNKDGMFTIRSPALQHAISTQVTNFRPHPYAEFHSQNVDHFSYFSNSETIENRYHNVNHENANLLGNKSSQINEYFTDQTYLENGMDYETIGQNGGSDNKTGEPESFKNYTSFGNLGSTNSDCSSVRDEKFSYFSTSTKSSVQKSLVNNQENNNEFCTNITSDNANHLFTSTHSNSSLSSQNIQRLNSQVTIHNISDSAFRSNLHEYMENEASVEITKMSNIQPAGGKFGNIGEELNLTRSQAIKDSVDCQFYHNYQPSNFLNGQSIAKGHKDSELVDNIFAPNQTVNLSELESEERDIESFKRFNYYFEPPKNKPKINLNVNDIVVRKKPSNA